MKTSACPTPVELSALLQGTLSDEESDLLTNHVGDCPTCQAALETIASGEVPVAQLVSGLEEANPPHQSNYWPALAALQSERGEAVAVNDPQAVPASMQSTVTPGNHVGSGDANSGGKTPALDFLEASDDPAYIGRLHHFQIARVIGQGGMGIVLEGFDTHLQRSVAIKVLNPQFQKNDLARQRFCREGRAAAAISHEHVVPMYQVAKAQEGEVAYLVMQLIEGVTLEQRLEGGKPLPGHEVAKIGMQVAAGLSAAHRRDMVHRDIKPANIIIESETDRVKLTDFGLARATDDVKLTKTGMVTGTPLYMSPEQTLGSTADERSDLFSLGAVLYEMATGIAPFQDASAIGVMKRIVDVDPDPPRKLNADISQPLSEMIMSLLAKRPDDRPQSASDVASALAAVVSEYGPISPLQVPAVASSEVRRLSGSHRRIERRWTLLAWAAAFCALMVAGAAVWMNRPDTGDNVPSIVLEGNPGTVWSVDFAPNGQNLAAAIEDGSVRVWDIDGQELRKSFNAHRGIVWTVAYHPSEPLVVTSGDDSMVKLWNSETFESVREWKATSAVRGVAFSPDGSRIVAGDREGNVHVYDIESGEELATKNHPGSILGVDYSHDGKLIASVGSEKVVYLFDAETLEERNSLTGHDGPIYNVKFAPKGPYVASVGWNGNVRVWNTETGREVINLEGSEGDVWGVSFCADATHVVTGEQLGAARVWEIATGENVATLRGHTSAVHNVSLDPTARRTATSSRDGTIRVWDMSGLAH